MPLAASREPTCGSVCSARAPSPAGSATEVSELVLDGEGPSLLSRSWREVGRCGGGSSLQTPRSLWLLGRGQILGTLCSKGKDSFPGRMGGDFSSARGPREDLRTEPCWTMWTLGARWRLSLHDARPLPHSARQRPAPRPPLSSQSSFKVAREAPRPEGLHRLVAERFRPRQMSSSAADVPGAMDLCGCNRG